MQKQKSILSFLKKPLVCAGDKSTPPGTEKLPPQALGANNDDGGAASITPFLFSTIKHKFMRSDAPKSASSHCRFEEGGNCTVKVCRDNDAIIQERSGMRPVVPRFKRVQESQTFDDEDVNLSLENPKKRQKQLHLINTENKIEDEFKSSSKFEWLHPSQIKDSKGRKRDNPLYDKKTLYIPPDALRKMSASQKQYWDVKCQYMDVVIFFKVGKFYELYELDAEIGNKELDWKMTVSGVGKCRQVGISESGIDDAVQKLIARGYNVGRVEQVETSNQAKSRGAASVIQRRLVQVITPATNNENIGADALHLLSLKENGSNGFGFAFVDCAALKFWVGSISDDSSYAALGALLMQVSPKEIIYERYGLSNEARRTLEKYNLTGLTVSQLSTFDAFDEALDVKNYIKSNKCFSKNYDSWLSVLEGLQHHDLAICAFGGLINHLSRLMLDDVIRNGDVLSYDVYGGCLRMDGQTLVNLEIFINNADGSASGTLYKYLNNCITSSAKRLLRDWICHPLKDVDIINNRLDVVENLIANSEVMLQITQTLRKIPDLERLFGRVKSSSQSSTLLLLPLIGNKILKLRLKAFGLLIRGMRIGIGMLVAIQQEGLMTSLSKVVSVPKLSGSDGLDKFLVQFEAAIDCDFPNYQNHDVTDSEAETLSILMELFIEKASQWSQVIYVISIIDVLRSFAVVVTTSSRLMCRPVLLPHSQFPNSAPKTICPLLQMKGFWHPYALGHNGDLLVPNNISLGGEGVPCSLLLTGPNMGGKSTLLRATCLAVILAQLGCFVPCEVCTVSVVDIIFTRLGASDRIMTGESTFLIECTETASVLHKATRNSLVILDELGRGTSTFDGYSIAYAVFRHLLEKISCRLLFATHYHSLTKEFAAHPNASLQHMACCLDSNSNNNVVFLYRLASGACPESYGLNVALMAGIPKQVVKSATEAGQIMKKMIGKSFERCDQRVNFSTLHEEWLKAILFISNAEANDLDYDIFDALICLWHEVKISLS